MVADVAELLWRSDQQAEQECCVRDLVGDARTGRKISRFYTQARLAVGDAIARPIPTPDRPVMKSPCSELRNGSFSKVRQRILIRLLREQNWITGDIVSKVIDDRTLDPSVAKI